MSIHDRLEAFYDSKFVIYAQIALPGAVMFGVNYLTGASMLQGLGSSLAIAAISKIDLRGIEENKYFKYHQNIQCIFANPVRHALASAIFYSAIQHAGLSHHFTMLLAKCCSTALFSSHHSSFYVNNEDLNSAVMSFSICFAEALASYVVASTLGEDYYFAQFMANVVARSLAAAGSIEYKKHNIKANLFNGLPFGFTTSVADTLAPITGTSPIVNLIPDSVSSFLASVVESVSSSVAAAVA